MVTQFYSRRTVELAQRPSRVLYRIMYFNVNMGSQSYYIALSNKYNVHR